MAWELVGKSINYTKVRVIHRLCTTLHKTIHGFVDIGAMEFFFIFFLYPPPPPPHIRKIKKVQ